MKPAIFVIQTGLSLTLKWTTKIHIYNSFAYFIFQDEVAYFSFPFAFELFYKADSSQDDGNVQIAFVSLHIQS